MRVLIGAIVATLFFAAPAAAVMVADPGPTAVTVPPRSTVAIAGAELVHVTTSFRVSPALENTCALATMDCRGTSLTDRRDKVIEAAGPATTFTSTRVMIGFAPGWIAETTTGIVLTEPARTSPVLSTVP